MGSHGQKREDQVRAGKGRGPCDSARKPVQAGVDAVDGAAAAGTEALQKGLLATQKLLDIAACETACW